MMCVYLHMPLHVWRSEDNVTDLRVSALQSVCECDRGSK